jgi:hypothetical protein
MPTFAPKDPGPDVLQGQRCGSLSADLRQATTNCNRTQEYGKLNDLSHARCPRLRINANHNSIH